MENLNFIASQRYFHVIAFNGASKAFNKKILNSINVTERTNLKDIKFDNILLKRFKISSGKPYHTGSEDFSFDNNGVAPFIYDFLLLELLKEKITFLCFPFKKLSKDVITELLLKQSLLKYGKFLKVDLNKLLKEDTPTNYLTENISYFFNSVELGLLGELDLSTVKLEGDKPLNSSLYKEVFKEKIFSDSVRVEKLGLKSNSAISTNDSIPKVNSSIHFDNYGNYKIYVQSSCENIITVPLIFSSLIERDCLVETSNNPTLALSKNEND
jgi:hypothetical protein